MMDFGKIRTYSEPQQYFRRSVPRRHPFLFACIPKSIGEDSSRTPPSAGLKIMVFMNPTFSSSTLPPPVLKPSPLHPDCAAQVRVFQWKGINTPPPSTILNRWLHDRESMVLRASISDPTSYGAGIKKFHIFCDLFAIPEEDRLPASFELLHSLVLWAMADTAISSPSSILALHSSPISESTVRHYLAALR